MALKGFQQQGAMPHHTRENENMLVKFANIAGGVFIEVGNTDEHQPSARCFRFDKRGNAEYAILADLGSSNPAPRWFGHCFKEGDFTFA